MPTPPHPTTLLWGIRLEYVSQLLQLGVYIGSNTGEMYTTGSRNTMVGVNAGAMLQLLEQATHSLGVHLQVQEMALVRL
jgi:hypothetical protein